MLTNMVCRLATSPALNHLIAIICLLILLLLAGCRSAKSVATREVTDSVRVEVRERIVNLRDTIYFEMPAQEKEVTTRDTTSTLNTDYAVSVASILADGSLFHSLKNKPQNVPIEANSRVIYRDSVVYVDRLVNDVKEVVVEKKPTLWERLKDVCLGVVVGVILFLFVRYFKPLRNLFN